MKIATILIAAGLAALITTAHADRAYDDWNAWWGAPNKSEKHCRLSPAFLHSDYDFLVMVSGGGSTKTFELVRMRGIGGPLKTSTKPPLRALLG